MMRKLFGLIFIGVFCLSIMGCEVEFSNDTDENDRKKKVESSDDGAMKEESSGDKVWKLVREDVYMVVGEQERPMSFYEYEYDESGNLIKSVSKQPLGAEEGKYRIGEMKEYRYDNNGEIIWEKYTHREGTDFVYVWTEDIYDENDILIEKRRGSGTLTNPEETGDDSSVTVEKYDAEGNLIEKQTTYKAEDGSEWTSPEYKVDKNGKELYQLSYSGQDKIVEGFKYAFDENGRETECVRYFTTGTIRTTTYTYEDTDKGYLRRAYTVESRRNDDGSMTEPKFEEATDFEYDANGYLIKYATYEREENFKQRFLYKWTERENDASGNRIKEIDYRGKDVEYVREYTYDDNDNCIRYMRYTADGATDVWSETEYDAHGNVTKDVNLNEDGSIRSGYLYEYDRFGNVSKEILYSDSVVTAQREYVYAEDGTLLKEIRKDGENAEITVYHYEMDEAGNMQKDMNYNEDGSISYGTEWIYDTEGLLQERIGYDQGKIVSHEQYIYESDLLVKIERTNADGKIVHEETYTYDKHDNLTEKLVNDNHDVVGGTIRTVYEYEKIKIK